MSGEINGVSPNESHAPTQAGAPRRALVLFFIVATAVIFVALFAVLYFRWAGAEEPSSVIMVAPTPAFQGAQITVEGAALPKPYTVKVPDRSGRTLPFYVDQGIYTVTVSWDGTTIYKGDVALRRNQMVDLKLEKIEHLLPSAATTNVAASTPG